MAPHSSTLAWKIPWTEEAGRLQSMGLRKVRHDWATSLSLFTFMPWRRKWQPTPVFLPGESQGRGSRTQLKRLSSSSSRDSVRFIWEEPEMMIRVPGVAVVQLLSRVQLFVTPWTAAHQALLSLTISWSCPVYDHWVGDVIQPSPSLLTLSPFAFNLFQHQSLFQWVSSSHQVAKLLELQLQQQSFHRIFRIDFL